MILGFDPRTLDHDVLENLEFIVDHDVVRVRVKTVGAYHIEIIPMAFNWRVHTIRVDGIDLLDWSVRYWCYKGRGRQSFVAAVLAAKAWDGADDTEPVGWIKAWDGRLDESQLS